MKKIALFCLLSLSMLCSSCFELIEDITLNNDGSGELMVKLNLSQSATKLNGLMALDSLNGKRIPTKVDIQDSLDVYLAKLNTQEGIDKAEGSVDFEYYIINLSLNFTSVEALEKAIAEISGDQRDLGWIEYQGKLITRKSLTILENVLSKVKEKDRERLREATYTSITRIEGEVSEVSNAHAKIAKNRKAVMQRSSVMDILRTPSLLDNTIQLK